MRKLALAAIASFFAVGLALATEVTFLSYDKEKHELKVKDGDKEMTLKVNDKTTFKRAGKDGDMDVPNDKGIETLVKMNDNDKAKGKMKFEVTMKDDTATEIKMKGGKGKN